MEFGWFDGVDNSKHNSIGLVEITTLFAIHDICFQLDGTIFDKV